MPKLAGKEEMKKGSKDIELQKMRKWAEDEGFELGKPFDAYHALKRNVEETVLLKVWKCIKLLYIDISHC